MTNVFVQNWTTEFVVKNLHRNGLCEAWFPEIYFPETVKISSNNNRNFIHKYIAA